MASPGNPAETRAYIIERLVGDTGEPELVIASARAMAERAVSGILDGLVAAFGAAPAVEVKAVETARFADARPTSPAAHALVVAASTSSPDALVIQLDPPGVALLVSTLFGGDPDLPVAPIERPLSPTEIDVATTAFGVVASVLNGSGSRSLDIKLPLPAAVTGPDITRLVLRDGPAARIDFVLKTNASSGLISVFMPQRVLLKHRSEAGHEAVERAAEWRARFNDEVMRSNVSLEATMPLSQLTLGDIASLQAGDIVALDEGAQAEVKLASRGQVLFVCEFGRLGQNYTVRVRHAYDAGQDFMDGLMPAEIGEALRRVS